jgi:hypothetical protein
MPELGAGRVLFPFILSTDRQDKRMFLQNPSPVRSDNNSDADILFIYQKYYRDFTIKSMVAIIQEMVKIPGRRSGHSLIGLPKKVVNNSRCCNLIYNISR